MRKFYLQIVLVLLSSVGFSQTAVHLHDPSSVCIDAASQSLGAVNFTTSTFTQGCQVSAVDVTIWWAKTDGNCPSDYGVGGCSFHDETSFGLNTPGFLQTLAVAGTWSGCATSPNSVTTTFSTSAGTPPSGTPVSGTFSANGGNMASMIGTSALGNWSLLAGDNGAGDPLLVGAYRLTVTTIPDIINPTLTVPASFSVNSTAGTCGAVATYSVSSYDLCGSTIARTAGPASGAVFPIGATTVTHRATDTYGRQTIQSFVVTVVDAQPPTITCPANITTPASSGVCSANVSYSSPSHSDLCTGSSLSLISGPVSGGSFNVGATTVTYRATDGAGNIANCSFTVTVTDTQDPQITCPGNSSINASPGQCSATTTYSTPAATDNCPGVTVTRTAGPASGGTFTVGSNTVTHQATDASGRTASCSFVVTVVDNQNPTITCPANISVNNTPNACSGVASWTAPAGADNCPGAVTIQTAGQASGSSFAAESTTTITYQVTDASSNTASCSFTVRVEDAQPPTITCPANISVDNDLGFCNALVTYATPNFSDNCPGVTILQTAGLPSNSQFGVNSSPNTLTFRATDAAGNQTSCSFTITVSDVQAPSITCPADIVVNNASGQCNAAVSWTPPVGVDNCPGQATARTAGPAPGSTFNVLNPTTITYTSTDAVANTSSCSFTVTVVDNEVPVVTCPANQSITFPNCQYALPNYVGLSLVTYSDNCAPLTVTQTPSAATVITQTTTVQVSIVDPSLNESICAFVVSPLDNTPPTFNNCPQAAVQVPVNSSCQFFMPDYSTMAVSDVCNPTLTLTQSPSAGSPQTLATSVTVTVSDGTNSTNCTFGVQPQDVTPPTLTCPGDRVEPANANCQFVLPNYTGLPAVVALDNCDPSPVVSQASVGNTITGSATVTLSALDASGNVGTCSFLVTVDDNIAPTITCPATQNVSYNANCSYAIASFTSLASGTDNCPGVVALSQSPTAGTLIGGASSLVTISGTDAAGNVGTCQFTLNISDNTPPAIACPPTQQVTVDAGCDHSLANFVSLAVTSDNCSPVTVTQSPAAATSYDLNVNPSVTVTLTASDGTNTASCNFDVLLNDETAPTIVCAADLQVLFNSNCQFTVGNRTAHFTSMSDNCTASPIVTQSPSSSTIITGQTTVTLTATDASGNAGTCTFQIIPSDSQAPTVVTCPQVPLTINYDANCNYTLADYTGNASFSDNCDQSLVISQSPGFGTVIGTQLPTVVTILAVDDAGNQNTCSITINPVDVTPPSLVCPSDQLEDFDANCTFTLLDYRSLAVASDNCSNLVTRTQFLGAGQVITGATSILITVQDNAGNSSQCTFNVIPNDNTPPTIVCPSDQTVALNAQCAYNMTDMTGLATGLDDNCAGVPVVTQSVPVGTSLGSNTVVVLTATDGSGNTATCSFSVLPTDQTAPSITCPQNQVVNVGSTCLYDLLSYTGQAVTDDNCDLSVTVTQSPAPSSGIALATVTTVTLTGTDDATNSASCSFTVSAVDNSAPTISCPTDTIVSTDANCQFVMIDETDNHELVIADNCDASPTVTQSPAAGTVLTANTTITLTVQDASGNTGSCTYSYTVQDLVDPTITCPSNQLISSNATCVYVIPDFTSSALTDDNCATALTITQSPLPLINSIVVDTVITLTVTDGNGNSADCSFLITADDNDLPNLTCPGDQLVSFDADCEYTLLDYTGLAVASDNCGTVTVTQDVASGTTITTIQTIDLTATDGDLNSVTCSFDVIPSDAGSPAVTCLQPAISVATGGQCSYVLQSYIGGSFVSATDNCSSSFVFTQSPVSGSLIGGATVVTISTIDASGNIGSCTMTVTPEDETDPQLFCPADITVNLNSNCEFTLADYSSLVFVSDNCDSAPFNISQSPASGSVITGEDETVVTLEASDNAGNIGQCTFSVFTEDDQAPSITCPASTTVSANSDCEFTLANYTGAVTVSDNCTESPTLVQSPSANGDHSAAVLVVIVATDGAGNSNNCSFTVTPVDDTAPSITCPQDQTPNFTSNCQFTIIDYTSLSSFSDFCDNTPFISQSPGTGTIISGDTPVTITVTDDAGNVNSCTFQVEPDDNIVPTIVCPAAFTVDVSSSCDFAIVDYTSLVTVTDNCDSEPTLIQSPATGTVSGGTVPITMTAIDADGNSSTCTFNLLLEDNSAPTLANCPSNQTVPLSANCQFIVANYLGSPLSVSDNCTSSPTLSQAPLAGSLIGGATVVTISANDGNGNIGTCSFTVTPADVTPPTILICPPSITDVNDPGICGALITYAPLNAIDNCAGVVVPSLTAGQASGTIFPVGVTPVTHVATDGSGNSSSCTFNVTVNDTEDPIILCPASISANVAPGTCAANVTYSLPTVTDNCTDPITPTLSAGSVSGSSFPVGATTVTYGAVDASANSSSCSFTITVVDDENPVITCPNNITVNNNPGICGATVTYSLPTVTDNCTNGIVPSLTAGQASGSIFAFGVTTNSYEAVDVAGNSASCSFTVTVLDDENPVLTCPNDTSISCDALVEYDLPSVTDNCVSGLIATQTSPTIGSPFSFGPNLVSFSSSDGNGNTGVCSFTVTIVDVAAPSIACPADQTALFNPNCTLSAPDYTSLATSSDNCDASPVITQSAALGATLTGPVSTITLTSTDFALNSASCTFTVSDSRPPVITCPADQVVASNINCEYALLNYVPLTTSSDNCGPVGLTQSPVAGTLISTQTTVVMTTTDNLGNESTCQFTVSLFDNIAPSITCIGNQLAFFDANCEYQLPDYTGQAGAGDNCDTEPTITQLPAVGSTITGSSVITLTASDNNGNSTSCTFSVNPIDVISPSITCPSTQVAQFNADCEFEMGVYTGLAITDDNCSTLITITQSPAVGSVHSANTIVALTANDGNGNTSSCAFLVVPEDNVEPVIICPADFQVYVNSSCEYSVINFTGLGTSSDNCSSSFIVTQSPAIGTIIASTTTITLTTNDGNGNSSTCEFEIEPTDNTAPSISCGDDQAVSFNEDCQFEILDYSSLAEVSDNCSSNIMISQSPAIGTFISGTTSVTLTANDGNGNVSSCSLLVIPADDTEPSIQCPADINVSFNANCSYSLVDYTGLANTDDNCSSSITVTQNLLPGQLVNDTVVVTLTANDGNGNVSSCSFSVNPSDNTAPTIVCPPNANVSLNSNCEFIVPDYKLITVVTDNCGPTSLTQAPAEGEPITVSTSIQMTVTDGNGNSVSCSFTVVPTDDEVPVINCPANITVSLNSDCQYPLPDYGAQGFASDNCTSPLLIAQFPPVGTVIVSNTTVSLSAQDASGNTATCSLVVTVEDDTAPVIAQCPATVNAVLNSNCSYVVPNFLSQVTATDNCDAAISYLQQPLAGATFSGAGTYPIIVGASDDANNYDTCMFNVVLTDFADPVVTCPPNQLVGLNSNCEYVIPSYTPLATASDACGTVTLTQSPAAATIITGQLNATIIATDGAGNTATCTFFVNVIPMTISVVGTDVTCNNGSNGSATVTVTGGTSPYSEDWGGFDPNALSSGNYQVTVSDVNGCSIVGSVSIGNGPTFEIEIDPSGDILVCSGESVVLDAGSGYALYNWSTGATVQSIAVSTPASYWVTATNGLGCVSNTDTVHLSFYPPLVPDVSVGGDGVLYCSNDTSSSYQWYFNNGPIANANSYWYCPTQSGNYYVRIIDANGCEVSSTIEEHTYDPTSDCATGIQERDLSMDIYPNPSTGQFVVNYSLQYQSGLRLAVFDLLGKQVGEEVQLNSISGTTIIDLSGQADGVYSLRVVLGKKRMFQERLVLVK